MRDLPNSKESQAKETPPGLEEFLERALKGNPQRLFELLTKLSHVPGIRPNYGLAEGFATTILNRERRAAKSTYALLEQMSSIGASEEFPECFLVICSGFASVEMAFFSDDARARRNNLAVVQKLATDERSLVRTGVEEALALRLHRFAQKGMIPAVFDSLWLRDDDSERWYGADILFCLLCRDDVFTIQAIAEYALPWTEEVLRSLADAGRAQERNPARRAALAGATLALPLLAGKLRGGLDFFVRVAELGKHPELRALYNDTLTKLKRKSLAVPDQELVRLVAAVDATKKPARDPTLKRQNTRNRGERKRVRSSGQ